MFILRFTFLLSVVFFLSFQLFWFVSDEELFVNSSLELPSAVHGIPSSESVARIKDLFRDAEKGFDGLYAELKKDELGRKLLFEPDSSKKILGR